MDEVFYEEDVADVFRVPVGRAGTSDYIAWNDEEGNHKIHLANWPSICMEKDFGGMGIPNLQDLNLCLIGSWIKRYIQGEGALWKRVIDAKYNTRNPNILA
jgi:hypothetical protein